MMIVPVVAFGSWHVSHAQILLASLRSEGNLPDVESKVIVYTDTPAAFSGYEVRAIFPNGKENKHRTTSNCYADSLMLGHPIVPVSADMICPTGMLAALERLAKTYRAVMVPVVRTEASSMRKALPQGDVSLSPRELCALAFRHLHPLQALMYWDQLPSSMAPTTVFRRVGNTIAARCFHMHPLMLRLPVNFPLSDSIDGELMGRIDPADCYVVTDSDETVVFDLTDKNYNWSSGYLNRWTISTPIDKWASKKTNKTHRWMFAEHECYIHSEDIEYPAPDARIDALRDKVRELQ